MASSDSLKHIAYRPLPKSIHWVLRQDYVACTAWGIVDSVSQLGTHDPTEPIQRRHVVLPPQ